MSISPDNSLKLVKMKRFLGLKVYEKKRSDCRLERSFAGSLYRESVCFANFGETSRQSWLFGLPLWGRKLQDHKLQWHLGSSCVVNTLDILGELAKDLDHLFAKESVKRVNGKKHVFVFWANSGEIALLLAFFFEKLMKKQGLTGKGDVVVLCTKKYHQEMLSFLFPEIPSVVAKPRGLRHLTDDADAGDWRIKMCFPGRYFAQLENTTRRPEGPKNYFAWMQEYFDCCTHFDGVCLRPEKKLLDAELSNALKKLKISPEELTRTIILSPGSFSCGSLMDQEVEMVRACVKEADLHLYYNPSDPKNEKFLTFPALYAAATQAAGLIGIRSGLMDWLSLTGIPSFVVYRPFPDRGFNTPARTIDEVFNMFSLRGLPNHSDNILETSSINQAELMVWVNSLRSHT